MLEQTLCYKSKLGDNGSLERWGSLGPEQLSAERREGEKLLFPHQVFPSTSTDRLSGPRAPLGASVSGDATGSSVQGRGLGSRWSPSEG